jgi:hypothetical protein
MWGNQLPVSAAKVAAWVPNMFCNFYLVENCKIAKNSTTANAREIINTN